jgi:molecular chaperone GrpE
MADPARDQRPDDAADIASTDMDVTPGGDNPPPPAYPEVAREAGAGAVPVEPDESRAQRLSDELEEMRDRHLRLGAEFDNYRKRMTRERAELADRAQATFAGRLLEILDDMDRLVEQTAQSTALDALREGVALVDRKLRKELEGLGLERIDPAGQPFDPNEHEAVSTTPAPEAARENLVSATFQPGYRFKGILVRPARVQVYTGEGQA